MGIAPQGLRKAIDSASRGSPTGTSGRVRQACATIAPHVTDQRSQHASASSQSGCAPRGTSVGHDEPVEIEVMEDQDPGCEKAKPERVSSDRPEEEQEERDHEMAETESPAQRVPRPRPAGDVPAGFLGEVCVPDQEILAEGDVGPEDHEAEEQLAQIVQVLGGDGPSRASPSPGVPGSERIRAASELTSEPAQTVDPVHRRRPVRIERHQPVEARHSSR